MTPPALGPALYPATVTQLFPKLARDANTPPFDVTKPPKYWAAPGVIDPYTYLAGAADGTQKAYTISAAAAAALNIPGPQVYPAYTPEPPTTDATVSLGSSDLGSPVDVNTLCLWNDAEAIFSEVAALLGGRLVVAIAPEGAAVYQWNSEQRRQWAILPAGGWVPSGINLNCQQLIAQKNALGIGAPGRWVLSGGTVKWQPSDAPAIVNNLPAVPIPERPLYAWEVLVSTNPLFPLPKQIRDTRVPWTGPGPDPAGDVTPGTIPSGVTLDQVWVGLQKFALAFGVKL